MPRLLAACTGLRGSFAVEAAFGDRPAGEPARARLGGGGAETLLAPAGDFAAMHISGIGRTYFSRCSVSACRLPVILMTVAAEMMGGEDG